MILAALPAYNEEVAVGSVVLRLKNHADKVIVVDDGSEDKTAEIAELAGATVYKHEKNLGKGAAIKTIFNKSRELNADILVLLDADGQHDPDEMPFLIESINNGVDIAIGSRFMDKNSRIPFYRNLGLKVLNLTTNVASFSNNFVKDTQSGYRAFSKKAIETLDFDECGLGIESEMLILGKKLGLNIEEVPISCNYDLKNKSTYNPVQHGLMVIASILRVVEQKRPLEFFGIPGFIFLIIGFWMGLRVMRLFSLYHEIAIGTAFLTVLFIIIGIFSVFTGIILHSVNSAVERIRRR